MLNLLVRSPDGKDRNVIEARSVRMRTVEREANQNIAVLEKLKRNEFKARQGA
jgi:hypothetical protein